MKTIQNYRNNSNKHNKSNDNGYDIDLHSNLALLFVGNKAKEQISKRVFQENKARQIFRKTNFFYLLIRSRMFLNFQLFLIPESQKTH